MSATSTCPYCNAVLSPDAIRRAICARCGETIPGRGTGGSVGPAAPSAGATPQPPARRGGSWTAIGVAVVAIALVVAFVVWKRWDRTPSPLSPGSANEQAVVRPAEMPGLGYLPESTEAILAVQMPLLTERLGPEAAGDPAGALRRLGVPDAVVETVERLSGVGLRNVDQVVVGLGFEKGSLPPQIVVVAHTREPYDLAAVARRAKARTQKRDGRTLHVASASPVPQVFWWGPSDRVLIGTILARDYDGVPEVPKAGIGHLRPDLTRLIADRVAEDACLWLVASSDKWGQYLVPYVALPGGPLSGRKDLLRPADRLRAVSLSVPFDPAGAVEVFIDRKSGDDGAELRAALAERFAGTAVEVDGQEETCHLRTRFDPEALESLINQITAAAK
jgi:hypothetical protein